MASSKGGGKIGVPSKGMKSKPLASVDKKPTPVGRRGKRSK